MAVDRQIRSTAPGLLVLAVGGVAAYAIATLSAWLDPLVVAVAIGVAIGNTVGVPSWAAAGVELRKLFLETGIVLLGASVALSELLDAGIRLALLVCATVLFGVLLVEAIGRVVFRLSGQLTSLLAAGSSICGVSAVAAIGRVLGARDDRLALAAATILLFDALTLVTFPILGAALGLSSLEFGVWAGLSMFSTGPVAAAGFAHSPEAGQWATVTKLARNSLLGVVAVGYSVVSARRGSEAAEIGPNAPAKPTDPDIKALWSDFPKFLVGFFLVAAIANSGLLSPASLSSIGAVTDWLFVLAFVGLGTAIRVRTMRKAGLAPVLVVLGYLLVISTLVLVAVRALF
ncbi:MAG: YeiH family protein [Halobacteriota archaeon]